jgi:hypothetical protein
VKDLKSRLPEIKEIMLSENPLLTLQKKYATVMKGIRSSHEADEAIFVP